MWLRYGFALLALCLAFPASEALAQRTNATPLASITVVGEASTDVPPDLAQIRVGVVSQGKTAREASDANVRLMNPVLAAVKESGIADADTQTSRLSLQPVYGAERNPQAKITGFQASNQITLKLRQIGKIAETLDRLIAAGANEIGGIEFLVAAPAKALDNVRTEAIADARRKAEIYARAAGVTLGRPLSITEDGAAPPQPMVMRAGSAASAMKVAPGEKTLNLSVMVSFELVR